MFRNVLSPMFGTLNGVDLSWDDLDGYAMGTQSQPLAA